jgi:serine/threonine-protein kinase
MGSGLQVCSRGVAMGYKGSDRDARRIGRELDVQVVVEGSVRKAPGSVRISARVVSVADGFQLWAQRFDGDEANLLVLNEQVAHAVADALTAELEAPKRAAADDVDAVDLYLRARDAYHHFVERGAQEAIRVFQAALARFPDDPRIVAGHVLASSRVQPDAEAVKALLAEAERALRLGPSLPDAHVALGAVLFHANDPGGAVVPLDRALQLAPQHAEAHDLLGRLLVEADLDGGARHLETALAFAPGLTLARLSLVRHYCLYGEWDRAEALNESAREPRWTLPMRARAALWRRDAARARELLHSLESVDMDDFVRGTVRGLLECAAFGTPIPPEALTRRNFASPRTRGFAAQLTAESAGAVGDTEGALAAFEAADTTCLVDLEWLDHCPMFDALRAEGRFLAVRAHVGERVSRVAAARAAIRP